MRTTKAHEAEKERLHERISKGILSGVRSDASKRAAAMKDTLRLEAGSA